MNNKEFVTALAARTDMTAREAGKHAATLMAELARALDENGALTVQGFGSFEVKTRGEREGRNPATGEKITIAASKSIAFTAAKALKDKVNG